MGNLTSRTITGGFMTSLGLVLIAFVIFDNSEFRWWVLFYGIPLIILGLFLLLNSKEDKIERIKSGRKKK